MNGSLRKISDVISESAFEQITNHLTEIKNKMEADGDVFLTDNIFLYDKNIEVFINDNSENKNKDVPLVNKGVAGEVDILVYNKKQGKFKILDIKTSKDSYYGDKHKRVHNNDLRSPVLSEEGEVISSDNRNKWDDHAIQLSAYSNLFERMTGLEIDEIGVIPFKLSYEGTGFINTVELEETKVHDYDSRAEYWIPKEGTKPGKIKTVEPKSKTTKGFGGTTTKTPTKTTTTTGKNKFGVDVLNREEAEKLESKNTGEGIGTNEIEEGEGEVKTGFDEFTKTSEIVDSESNENPLVKNTDTVEGKNKIGEKTFKSQTVTSSGEGTSDINPFARKTETTETTETSNLAKGNDNNLFGSLSKIDDEDLDFLTERDVSEEYKEFRKMLPHVPGVIERTLFRTNDGGYAEGVFFKGIAKVSTFSREGTFYHEGFHAVTQMYLTEEERNELYKEWGELTGNPNPKLT
jgi:hypothetical protein